MKIKSILFISLVLTVRAFAVQFIPIQEQSENQLKALELTIQNHQFFLALIGATLAYFLTSGTEILTLFKKPFACSGKTVIILCVLLFLITALMLIWNQYTIVNQLRNGFQDLNDLLDERIYFSSLAVAVILFFPSVYFIWKEKKNV